MKKPLPVSGNLPYLHVLAVLAGILLIGGIDYLTGIEVRVYPLYFLPLCLAAWHFGKRGAVITTLLASAAWFLANRLAGLSYSRDAIWLFNVIAQATAFGTVGFLVAWARQLLIHERELARTDPLTGLSNRLDFLEKSAQLAALCDRYNRPLTLAYIDLDNFKSVNDRFGHARGDEVLRRVADTLRRETRRTDVAARVGGDEFVLCLPEISSAEAMALLERILKALVLELAEVAAGVSASVGAVYWSSPRSDIETMVSRADSLMYSLKQAGKNRVQVIDAGHDA